MLLNERIAAGCSATRVAGADREEFAAVEDVPRNTGSDEKEPPRQIFTGRSLKDDPTLWRGFTEIRKAENALAHEGFAMVGGKPIDSGNAKAMFDTAERIIAWVEHLLPEAHRPGED